MKIKAVLLDFGGTLADGGLEWEPYHEAIRNYLTSLGHNIPMKTLKKALRGALADLDRIRAKGKERTFEEVYSNFLGKLGIIHDDEMLEWLHDNFKVYYKTSFYPCVEELLQELSSKYKVAMVSNTMSDQPRELLQEADMDKYFDLLVCSRDLGVRKPNPEIFKIVLDKIEFPSSNPTWFSAPPSSPHLQLLIGFVEPTCNRLSGGKQPSFSVAAESNLVRARYCFWLLVRKGVIVRRMLASDVQDG